MKKTGNRIIPALLFTGLFLFSSCPQEPGLSVGSPPPVPEGLAVESGNRKLYASWLPAPGAAEYRLYWDTVAAETPPAGPGLTIPGTAGIISGLDNNREYQVWVRAVNSAGESGLSPPETGTPAGRELPQYSELVSVPGGTVTGTDDYALTVTVPEDPPGYTNPGSVSLRKGVFVKGRRVTVEPFYMAKYETTRELWFAVQDWAFERGYQFQNPKTKAPAGADKNKPVAGISWRDAVVWCNAYSEMTGLDPVYRDGIGSVLKDARNAAACDGAVMDKTKSGFRLPTEVEREFAARGGDPELPDWKYMYAGSNTADDVAWHHGNSAYQTRVVGTKAANRLSIHDLSGNVQEWGWDWMNWAVDVTQDTPGDGADYSKTANQKPFNGGGVGSNATMSCVACRWGYTPDYKDNYVGFRVVCKP
jgi:formylglycine-generating enzyme required for sulfatase activity